MPDLFGNLDLYHPALQWKPASGPPPSPMSDSADASPAAANRTHPYLRANLLTNDYAIFDAERARLYRRARRAGLVVVPMG